MLPVRRFILVSLLVAMNAFAVPAAWSGETKKPAAESESAAPAASGPLSMEDLRQRIAERIEMAQAGKAHSGVPAVNVAVKGRPATKAPPRAAVPASAPAVPVSWSYEGPGAPDQWAALDPANAACGRGQRQSPIDLRDGFKVDLEPIQFDYHPGRFSVLDNSHTVQVDLPEGNAIVVNQQRFVLTQLRFHRPSEERIDGQAFDMSVHLEHRDEAGRLAILAVLLKAGRPHPAVQQVWNSLPLEKGTAQPGVGTFDPATLLPADRRYFAYMGSLTRPPCTEGVLWLVLKQPVEVAPDQVALFARLYPGNARPVQPTAGRIVKESR